MSFNGANKQDCTPVLCDTYQLIQECMLAGNQSKYHSSKAPWPPFGRRKARAWACQPCCCWLRCSACAGTALVQLLTLHSKVMQQWVGSRHGIATSWQQLCGCGHMRAGLAAMYSSTTPDSRLSTEAFITVPSVACVCCQGVSPCNPASKEVQLNEWQRSISQIYECLHDPLCYIVKSAPLIIIRNDS